ncbi:MAG: T9SS type A sorting domain-containing protein [Bacteroidales bacterium]|nr:T9SS type A sorting domain-containing protein [Bacteroidales bacterium]
MRKLLLSILMLTIFGLWTNAQTIENFESITMNLFSGGTNGAISVVANPDTAGNPSMYVGKMVRGFDGDPWAGWYSDVDSPIDVTAYRYVHVKIWKPRISPIVFKYEWDGGNSGDVNPMTPQATESMWEDFVFDMSVVTNEATRIVLIPDFETPLTLTEDIILYFDDLYINDDPAVGSDPVMVLENFETIPLNYMLGGEEDMSYMELIPNPDANGINVSPYVCHFFRDMNGVPWGGFWSGLPSEIDVTDNKYVHVKVWKPRISPIKFKIEGGEAGTIEVESMYPQTMTNAWEDIVFDFSEKTGTYPIIAFMPDFVDPVGLTEDIDIYFDDIILNNDPNPMMNANVTINLDMTDAIGYASEVVFDPTIHNVYIAGDFAGWSQPGSEPSLMLSTEDNIHYSISLVINDGPVQFKYFFAETGVPSWDNGEWNGDPNRQHIIMGETNFDHVWGNKPSLVTFNVDMTEADPFDPATDEIYMAGELYTTWNQPGTVPQYKMLPTADNEMIYTLTLALYNGDHQYKYFRVINGEASWDNGEWTAGDNRLITVDTLMAVNDVWGSPASIYNYPAITFNMYPNPANENLTINNLLDAERIDIYDITGQLVRSFDNTNAVEQMQINIADLTKGMYILTVRSGNSSVSSKLMKY